MNVTRYLSRILYTGKLVADSETLFALHERHVKAIPFENMQIMAGEKINLDGEFLFQKIIEEKRGGVCYELNAIFYELLLQVGFNVTMHSAITRYGDEYGEEFDHMFLVVESGRNHWLVDVGLREPMHRPVNLFDTRWQTDRIKNSKVVAGEKGYLHFLRSGKETWKEEYKFSLLTHSAHEFEDMCRFHESNNKSPLNRYVHCAIATNDSLLTIKGNRIIKVRRGTLTFDTLTDDDLSFQKLVKFCIPFSFRKETVEQLFFMISKSRVIAA
jgi:N-hydroxyarylamine O-acetyltransferase